MYLCEICEAEFDTSQELAAHMRWTHGAHRERQERAPRSSGDIVVCPSCGGDNLFHGVPRLESIMNCPHCGALFNAFSGEVLDKPPYKGLSSLKIGVRQPDGTVAMKPYYEVYPPKGYQAELEI